MSAVSSSKNHPNKIVDGADAALADMRDGARVMVGGFGLSGNPENLIRALARRGTRDLTIISNNCGNQGKGLAVLLQQKQVARVVCSFVGGNPDLEEQMLSGAVKVELNPQGTLAERIRAGGAGIPAFFTATGVGTLVAEGKEVRNFNGRDYVMETGLVADLSIVKAWKADGRGNLQFRKTARNFNPMMATAGKVTVVEVEHIVPTGSMDPDQIHTPGIYVDRIVLTEPEKRIEQRTVRARETA